MDNLLVPTAAGTSRISSTFAGAASRSFSLTVRDTYQPTWPSAAALSDTSAQVDANMSDAQLLVTYLMVPSAQLDLLASPPVMPALGEVQAGGCRPMSSLSSLMCSAEKNLLAGLPVGRKKRVLSGSTYLHVGKREGVDLYHPSGGHTGLG